MYMWKPLVHLRAIGKFDGLSACLETIVMSRGPSLCWGV